MSKGLTYKQKTFVNEYIRSKNGSKSAMKAYDVKNEAVARSIASQNLTKLNIKDAIDIHLQASGYSPIDSIQRLTKTAEAGAEIKATAREQIRADELLLKLSGHLVKRSQSYSMSMDFSDKEQCLAFIKKYENIIKRRKQDSVLQRSNPKS